MDFGRLITKPELEKLKPGSRGFEESQPKSGSVRADFADLKANSYSIGRKKMVKHEPARRLCNRFSFKSGGLLEHSIPEHPIAP